MAKKYMVMLVDNERLLHGGSMVFDNPTIHNGFTITAFACELPEGCWQGQLVLSKCGFEEVTEPNLQNRATEQEAVQSALAMGWQIANYATPNRILDDK